MVYPVWRMSRVSLMGNENQIDCPIAGVILFTNPKNGTIIREIPKLRHTLAAWLMPHLTSAKIDTFEDKFPFPKVG